MHFFIKVQGRVAQGGKSLGKRLRDLTLQFGKAVKDQFILRGKGVQRVVHLLIVAVRLYAAVDGKRDDLSKIKLGDVVQKRQNRGEDGVDIDIQRFKQNVALVVEVPVDDTGGNARRFGDLGSVGAKISFFRKKIVAGFDDSLFFLDRTFLFGFSDTFSHTFIIPNTIKKVNRKKKFRCAGATTRLKKGFFDKYGGFSPLGSRYNIDMKQKALRIVLSAAVCFALTFLFSAAVFPPGLSPFYTGAYLPMVSLGGNYFALSTSFLLARFAFGGDLYVLLQSAFLALGVGVVRAAALIRRRKIHPFYTVLSAFFAELPMMAFLPVKGWISLFANGALAALFCFLVLPGLSKLRKGILLFGEWEAAVAGVIAFALGAGSFATVYFGISPYYLLFSFLLPTSVFLLKTGAIPLTFAIGATAVSGDLAPALAAAFAVVLCESLKGKRAVAAFSLLIAEGAVFFLFPKSFSPLNFLFLFSGSFVAAFLPDAFYRKGAAMLGRGERNAPYAMVNKARLEIVGKLGFIGDALRKTSESLCELSGGDGEEQASARLAEEFSATFCNGCKSLRDCLAQGGGNTASLFQGAIFRALKNGRATICDLPPYLNGNCPKAKAFLDALNEATEIYREEKTRNALRNETREKLAGEAEGIAGVLDVLRRDLRRAVTFDGKKGTRVLAELKRAGILSYDAMVAEGGDASSVTVTLEEAQAKDGRVLEAVSRAMELPLLPEGVTRLGAGSVAASFRSAPPFDAIVGQAVRIKAGSDACGDTKSVTRLNGDRIMIALSDGMGSGEEANKGSAAALSLVENFYRTGVDEKTVLPLINHLLTMRNDGSFQTLDMCVVDLRTAEADFIKLSAPESVIKRREGSEIVEGGALPLGILREIKPSVSRRKLSSGDVVVLATDGVTDAIGADGMMRVVESGRTNNPQTIADNVVRDASYVSQADDQTVVALRLFRRVG